MKKKNLLLSLAIGVTLQANAIDFSDHEAIPGYYAAVDKIVDEATEEVTYNVDFDKSGRAWRPSALNTILSSYGAQLNPEVAEVLPSDYASVQAVEVEAEEGAAEPENEVEYKVNFRTGGVAWRPQALHNILTAYDLVPNLEENEEGQFADLPSDFGAIEMVELTVTDEQTGEQTQQLVPQLNLGSSAILWNSSALHRIISAYKQG